MRKSLFVLIAVAAVSFSLFSCDNDKGVRPQSEEYVEVRFQANSLEFSASPMTKSVAGDGLYGIQLHSNGSPYACLLTEDLSSQSFKLIKGDTYHVSVVYVPDAKDIIENNDGYYGAPFSSDGLYVLGGGTLKESPRLGAGVYYSSSVELVSASRGIGQRKGSPVNKLFSDVPLYSGGSYFTADEDQTVSLNLYSCMFGLSVRVSNLNEGKVHIYHGGFTIKSYSQAMENDEKIFTLTSTSSSIDVELEMPSVPFGRDDYAMTHDCWSPCWINIEYESPDGTFVTLYSKDMEVYRMTRYSLDFDLEEALRSVIGGVEASLVDENWSSSTFEL